MLQSVAPVGVGSYVPIKHSKAEDKEYWAEEIRGIRERFKNIMLIITNFQIKYLEDRASMQKTQLFEEVFDDNAIFCPPRSVCSFHRLV